MLYHSNQKVTNTLADQLTSQDLMSASLILGLQAHIVPGIYKDSGDLYFDPQSYRTKLDD